MKHKYPCPECKGTGKTLTPFEDCIKSMKLEKCKKCDGLGWFEIDVFVNIDRVDEEGEVI